MTEPVATYRYTLTRADALAWESRPVELRGWGRLAFLLWLGTAGLVTAMLPPDLVGAEYDWRFWLVLLALIGVNWLLAKGALRLLAQFRAARRLLDPVQVELADWNDHLTATVGSHNVVLAYETVTPILTPTHLFIAAPPEVVIMPLAAFETPADMAAFADTIERVGHE